MQVREVTIKNVRGIRSSSWRSASSLVRIVGAGDSCKSTILDAIEMTLSTRWLTVTDVDTTQAIEVVVTLGIAPTDEPSTVPRSPARSSSRAWSLTTPWSSTRTSLRTRSSPEVEHITSTSRSRAARDRWSSYQRRAEAGLARPLCGMESTYPTEGFPLGLSDDAASDASA
jgi:hypothetical protein